MAVEVSVRLAGGLALGAFAFVAWLQWSAAPERITLLLLVATSSLTVGLALFTRVPAKRDWRLVPVVVSVCGTFYFLAVRLEPGMRLIPENVGAFVCGVGILWQLYAKASLRRSFGIVPANRGIVSSGAYRWVRHPIYLGYVIADMGFLLTNFGAWNVTVYGGLLALQVIRILQEERFLASDPAYGEYRAKVRYRVLPGLF
ncbi:isoprenylcysteine carboxyl methyltransferase [Pandoraea pulmonicola]|nr:isoprenylcysteine carboxylmethyltransferase family protein [Pandoraea pulmonicola]AJC23217.1 isoprenylcysteine carboxyl methyltransferase [Pandoraea pulmonicola]